MRAAVSTWLALLLLLPAAAQTGRPPAGKPAAKPSAGAKPATPAVSGPDLPSRLPGTAPFCVVNGEKIPLSTYVDRLSLTYAPQMRELLILETLLRQECKARKVSATPEEVAAVTQKALEDHARRNNGMAGLTQELLRTRGWSVADFRRVIRDQAEGQILRDKLGTVLVKASDVKDTDLEPLYQQRREAFRQPDRVRMSHILIRRPPDADEAQEKAVRSRAEALLKQVLDARGGNFEALAREHSEDKETGARGGRYPVQVARGANPFGANFEATVFSAAVGVTPEVVATPQGFHVIRVDEKEEGRYLALAEVREQLRLAVLTERRERALDELFVRLRTRARVETGKF